MHLPPELGSAVAAERSKLAAAELPAGLDAALAVSLRRAIEDAYVGAFRLAMVVCAGLAAAGAIAALALVEPRHRRATPSP